MTAINVLVRPDRVHVMTDGAVFEPEGAVIGVMQKTYALAHVSAVIAIRGPTYLGAGLVEALNLANLRTFDDLLARLPATARVLIDHAMQHMNPAERDAASARIDLRKFDIAVAGWSHRRGQGETYRLDTSKPGWHLERQADGFFMPADNPALLARLDAAGWDLSDPEQDAARLLELMHHQRAVPDRLPSGVECCTVGGFAQHTVITPDAITTRIVERWADRAAE
ncbi:hypothetical protein DK419_16095 [Methylobacterium terrae]|uniref:Uncharacterized protein n=1 Tax=Methylobacterium terrae TaxID=2202827 RepID=A0A2U8WNJ0_9HYPH|nr:hypothetical protein [Methylobacterium terrae]AWN47647.1 hypothetical protein DK419_16095 [Methylobacterium terrae]